MSSDGEQFIQIDALTRELCTNDEVDETLLASKELANEIGNIFNIWSVSGAKAVHISNYFSMRDEEFLTMCDTDVELNICRFFVYLVKGDGPLPTDIYFVNEETGTFKKKPLTFSSQIVRGLCKTNILGGLFWPEVRRKDDEYIIELQGEIFD